MWDQTRDPSAAPDQIVGSDAALDGPLRGHASEGALRACRCPIGSDIESPQAVERRKELGGREILLRLLGSTLRAEKQALERANRLKRGAEYALERRREGREGWGREGRGCSDKDVFAADKWWVRKGGWVVDVGALRELVLLVRFTWSVGTCGTWLWTQGIISCLCRRLYAGAVCRRTVCWCSVQKTVCWCSMLLRR